MLIAESLGAAQAHDPRCRELGVHFVRGSVSAVEPGHVVLRAGAHAAATTRSCSHPARAGCPRSTTRSTSATKPACRRCAARAPRRLASVAFVAPLLTGWLLPLYEAALLTARLGPRVTLTTPEQTPLQAFGAGASAEVARALDEAGIEFRTGTHPPDADRIVSLPLLRGPQLPGVPETGLYGLIPIDGYGRVTGLADVYAIGDATDFPLKQGGIACLQADAAAGHIAARYGAPVTPQPFHPELRAVLLTGTGEIALGGATRKLPGRYLAAQVEGTSAPPSSAIRGPIFNQRRVRGQLAGDERLAEPERRRESEQRGGTKEKTSRA